MFPQLKKINNESGVVLFIVLMMAIVMMIYALGIMTQSMNEINYAQQQIDQIAAEQWAKGAFWNAETTNFAGGFGSTILTTNIDGRNYVMNFTYTKVNAEANQATVTTNYDTFQ